MESSLKSEYKTFFLSDFVVCFFSAAAVATDAYAVTSSFFMFDLLPILCGFIQFLLVFVSVCVFFFISTSSADVCWSFGQLLLWASTCRIDLVMFLCNSVSVVVAAADVVVFNLILFTMIISGLVE